MSRDSKALLTYYGREGLFQHLQAECNKQLERRGADGTLMWWRAIAVGMSGDAGGAVRELEELRAKRDLQLPVQTALLHFHKRASRVDMEEVSQLEQALPTLREMSAEPAHMLAAQFHWFAGVLPKLVLAMRSPEFVAALADCRQVNAVATKLVWLPTVLKVANAF